MSVVRPDQTPPLLTTLARRTELLRQTGVDEVVVVEFTPEVASWSPAEFVDTVLRPLNPIRIVVGRELPLRLPGVRRRPHPGRAGPGDV